jgi:hypothetical protein
MKKFLQKKMKRRKTKLKEIELSKLDPDANNLDQSFAMNLVDDSDLSDSDMDFDFENGEIDLYGIASDESDDDVMSISETSSEDSDEGENSEIYDPDEDIGEKNGNFDKMKKSVLKASVLKNQKARKRATSKIRERLTNVQNNLIFEIVSQNKFSSIRV